MATSNTPKNNPLGATNDGSAKQDPKAVAGPDASVETAKGNEEVKPSPRASINVQTVFPTRQFVVEGVPTITREGTKLTKTQLDEVLDKAKASGVVLSHDADVTSDKEEGSK